MTEHVWYEPMYDTIWIADDFLSCYISGCIDAFDIFVGEEHGIIYLGEL